jgi:hypothetical protein
MVLQESDATQSGAASYGDEPRHEWQPVDDGYDPDHAASLGHAWAPWALDIDFEGEEGDKYIESQLESLRREVEAAAMEAAMRPRDMEAAEQAPAEPGSLNLDYDMESSARVQLAVTMARSILAVRRPAFPWEGNRMGRALAQPVMFPIFRTVAMPPPVPRPPQELRSPELSERSEPLLPPVTRAAPGRKPICRPSINPGRGGSSAVESAVKQGVEQQRARAILGFTRLMRQDPDGFIESEVLMNGGDALLDGLFDHLVAVFARKATSTLSKRLGSWNSSRGGTSPPTWGQCCPCARSTCGSTR